MRSILVTVDDTPSAVAARGLAVALAGQCGAQVRGVTALDVSDLDRVDRLRLAACNTRTTGSSTATDGRRRGERGSPNCRHCSIVLSRTKAARRLPDAGSRRAPPTAADGRDVRPRRRRARRRIPSRAGRGNHAARRAHRHQGQPSCRGERSRMSRERARTGSLRRQRSGREGITDCGSAGNSRIRQGSHSVDFPRPVGSHGGAERAPGIPGCARSRRRSRRDPIIRPSCRSPAAARVGSPGTDARDGCVRPSRLPRDPLRLHDPASVRQGAASALHPSLSGRQRWEPERTCGRRDSKPHSLSRSRYRTASAFLTMVPAAGLEPARPFRASRF